MRLGSWLLWLAAIVVAVIVLVPAALLVSSLASLDRDRRHAEETRALPRLSTGASLVRQELPPEGVVQISTQGMVFRARVAGLRGDGPALVLLHGFPETSIMWEPLIRAAAAEGFRVVAFDQRGYSPGARPDGVEAYQLPLLTADVFAIADAVGFERFHLVGHDWGALVGWAAAGENRDRVLSYASLSIPHPSAIRAANAEKPGYVHFFQTTGVPETFLSAGGLFLLESLYATMPAEQVAEYLAVFSEPGALTAVLNWYRATEFLSGGELAGEIEQPVLYVFGSRDMPFFVRPDVRDLQRRYLRGSFREVELDAGHWLIQEETDDVVDAIMSHLLSPARE